MQADSIVEIAKAAGEAILTFYDPSTKKAFELKEDHSPVTQADLAANKVIVDALKALSDLPIISEEEPLIPWEQRQHWRSY